jgi:hypothetical protein
MQQSPGDVPTTVGLPSPAGLHRWAFPSGGSTTVGAGPPGHHHTPSGPGLIAEVLVACPRRAAAHAAVTGCHPVTASRRRTTPGAAVMLVSAYRGYGCRPGGSDGRDTPQSIPFSVIARICRWRADAGGGGPAHRAAQPMRQDGPCRGDVQGWNRRPPAFPRPAAAAWTEFALLSGSLRDVALR